MAKNYGRLGSTWAEFYGRDVPDLVEALEEAQRERDAAIKLLRKVRPSLSGTWNHLDTMVDVFLDAILSTERSKEGNE